jgi:transcriptional regulator with XRE-family HTH domain
MEPDLTSEIIALLEQPNWSRERLASELGVSVATVARWCGGAGRPRPRVEGRLRSLLSEAAGTTGAGPDKTSADSRIRVALGRALNEAREALHRHARLSTRHEALDEICKLLFAQIVLARDKGTTLSNVAAGSSPAVSLAAVVRETFATHLPHALSEEMPLREFELRLRPTEDELARELATAFSVIEPDLVIEAEHHDVFNDVFGSFLADSFGDEKQLGQYLTPPEVVRFMVDAAMAGMTEDERETLRDPSRCDDFGLILDPSCGVGSFLTQAGRCLAAGDGGLAEERLSALSAKVLVGIDKSERMIRLALTSFALLGTDEVNLHLANSLARDDQPSILQDLESRAGLILTNPPFGAEFSGEAIRRYELGLLSSKVDSELLFLERYLDWLREGGSALAIVPDSVLTNRGAYRLVREMLGSRTTIETVVSLPTETFSAAGTGTKTSVLHFKKNARAKRPRLSQDHSTYVALCTNVGFGVATRGSHRKKIVRNDGQLPEISAELSTGSLSIGRRVRDLASFRRWDATYHASLPPSVEAAIAAPSLSAVHVRDVAALSGDRVDPRRLGDGRTFKYIEISDVDGTTGLVQAKNVPCAEAPSRARKLVAAGDVLVSTVRPERRAIGVVPSWLDGAICSTGFAVLKPKHGDPAVLAALLRTDFVTSQILRNNMGVAYPAVDETCIEELLLPVEREGVAELAIHAERARQAQEAWYSAQTEFASAVGGAVGASALELPLA